MSRSGFSIAVLLAVCVCLLPSQVSASTIAGGFGTTGYIVVTDTTMTFSLIQGGAANEATISSGTGGYTSYVADVIGIAPLNITTETVGGSTSYSDPFITIPGTSPVETLDITYIAAGVDPSTDCTAPPAVGQTCTPLIPGGSPFNLENITDPLGGISTNFSVAFSGTVAGGSAVWSGTFSGTVNGESFQTLIAQAGSGGVGTTYSGTFDVTVVPTVPEPGTLLFAGAGALLILLGFVRRTKTA